MGKTKKIRKLAGTKAAEALAKAIREGRLYNTLGCEKASITGKVSAFIKNRLLSTIGSGTLPTLHRKSLYDYLYKQFYGMLLNELLSCG